MARDRLAMIRTLMWFTTPAELHRIADEMRDTWLRSLGGESLVVRSLLHEAPPPANGDALELQIVIDQERIREEVGR